jgi:hypothetical protein
VIQTPLEVTGQLTDHAALATWLTQLAADSPRVRVETVGKTVGGLDIFLVAVGYPIAPPAAGATSTRSMLVTGYQHGPEVAGREGAIEFIRNMAYTTDPSELNYLHKHPVYVMPMVNADRAPQGIRQNLNNVDINRNHVALTEPEARAIQEVVSRIRPQISVDLHENDPFPNDAQLVGVNQAQASNIVRSLSDELYLSTGASIVKEGYSYEFFAAGTHGPDILRNVVGLRHGLAMVMETSGTSGPILERTKIHLAVLRGAWKFHVANAGRITTALKRSKALKVEEGNAGTPFALSPTVSLNPAPRGYRLTAAQYAQAKYHLDTFGIQSAPLGGDRVLTVAQPMSTIIPFLLDGASEYKIVSTGATAITTASGLPTYIEPTDPPTWSPPDMPAPSYPPGVEIYSFGPIRVDGLDCPVTSVSIMVEGQLLSIYTG